MTTSSPTGVVEIGMRFGNWIVTNTVERHPERPIWAVRCKCECGVERLVELSKLKRGTSRSCGHDKGGQPTHGLSGTPLYQKWNGLKSRCTNENHREYKNYGARGITVCDEWRDSFEAFRDWALAQGYSDDAGMEIDRIDNDGGYSPDNCRFTTRSQQLRNTRYTRYLTAYGVTKSMADWAEDERCRALGITYNVLNRRISSLGWDDQRSLTERFNATKSNGSLRTEDLVVQLLAVRDLTIKEILTGLYEWGWESQAANPQRSLQAMVSRMDAAGVVERVGEGRGVAYRLPEKHST